MNEAAEWTTADVLAYVADRGRRILAGTWHAYVSRGQAPAPVRHVGKTPLWSAADVKRWTEVTGRRQGWRAESAGRPSN